MESRVFISSPQSVRETERNRLIVRASEAIGSVVAEANKIDKSTDCVFRTRIMGVALKLPSRSTHRRIFKGLAGHGTVALGAPLGDGSGGLSDHFLARGPRLPRP